MPDTTQPKSSSGAKNGHPEERSWAPHEIAAFSVERFLHDLDAAREMYETVNPILHQQDQERSARIKAIISELQDTAERAKERDNTGDFVLSGVYELLKQARRLNSASKMFQEHSIVLLVSRFDEYLAELLSTVFKAKPERFKGRGRSLDYDRIFDAKSVEDLIRKFIEEEIDKLLRTSHREQLEYLDKYFKVGIKEHFLHWKEFIEITERRNLYVHTGGLVSQQYLDRCRESEIQLDTQTSLGSYLRVSDDYFSNAFLILFELGLRIGQGIYRRVFDKDLDHADREMNNLGVELLQEERWQLAEALYDFALGLPTKFVSSDAYRKMFLVNKAIALKWGGKSKEMNQLLETVDWSAAHPKFSLAVNVLQDRFDEASKIMEHISREEVNEHGYRTWPVFRDFRSTEQFTSAFYKVFGVQFDPALRQTDLVPSGRQEDPSVSELASEPILLEGPVNTEMSEATERPEAASGSDAG